MFSSSHVFPFKLHNNHKHTGVSAPILKTTKVKLREIKLNWSTRSLSVTETEFEPKSV